LRTQAIGADEKVIEAEVNGLRARNGQVRLELTSINSRRWAAVACHEHLRSDLANKTSLEM
jgi:hypothetical protein